MQIKIFKDYNALSLHAANEIIRAITLKPDSVLCLAAGDTPRLTYRLLKDRAREEKISLSRCTFIGLDEWIGIPPSNEGSCRYFLNTNLFTPLHIPPSQVHLFDALAADPASECRKMDAVIRENGGIDLMLVGVGMNGHIGFNEPGVPANLYAHVVELDSTTKSVGQKYFKESTSLQKGITLGLQHFLESRKALMLACGRNKAPVIREALEGPVTPLVPATVIREHHEGTVLLDEEAAGLLRARV